MRMMRSLAPPVSASAVWAEQVEKGQFRTGETLRAGPMEGELEEGKQIVGLLIPELLLLLLRICDRQSFV